MKIIIKILIYLLQRERLLSEWTLYSLLRKGEEKNMDAKLVRVIESLPPEMKVILDHDQNFTGFNIESILL